MFRVLLVSLLLGAALFGGIVWYFELPIPWEPRVSTGDPTSPVNTAHDPDRAPKVELGEPLYPAEPFPELKTANGSVRALQPLAIRGTIVVKDKQEVPSQVSGQMLFIGDGVPGGAVEAAGVAPFMVEPFGVATVNMGDERTYMFFRRLGESMVVTGEQMLGMIDPSRALLMLEEKEFKIVLSAHETKSAEAAADDAQNRAIRERDLFRKNASSAADVGAAVAAELKFREDFRAAQQKIKLSENELRQAQLHFRYHELRNKVPFRRSMIKQIYKFTGDPVKEQEPVMQVYSLDNFLAEALVEAQHLDRIRPEMNIAIEPTHEKGPADAQPVHRGEVTAVAFTNDADRPRVVSGGLDRALSVWVPFSFAPPARLRHSDSIRSVACSPVAAGHNLALAGCADGNVYVWNVEAGALADANKAKPLHVVKAHDDAVTAVAFSPDGKLFATGGADGSIALWTAADGKVVYRFDHEHGVDLPHQGTVTALHFTPQARLVSAGRDNTLRVWKLHEKGAELEGEPVANRSGNVSQLGVSQDGKWMLFDQGRTLQLMSVQHGTTVTTLQSPGSTTPFETLAVFSPDSSLLLTAGAPEGRMQLWRSPGETGRGSEVRQFVADERVPPTCAAIAPRFGQGKGHGFAVSGAANGKVYLWALPTKEEVAGHRIENVQMKVVGQSLDPSTRQMRIAVEVPNADGRLMPGRPVTIVIAD